MGGGQFKVRALVVVGSCVLLLVFFWGARRLPPPAERKHAVSESGSHLTRWGVDIPKLLRSKNEDQVMRAVAVLEQAALNGDAAAQSYLGYIYLYPVHGVNLDYALAEKWLRMANRSGEPGSSFLLAMALWKDKSNQVTRLEISNLLVRAIGEGDKEAESQLKMISQAP